MRNSSLKAMSPFIQNLVEKPIYSTQNLSNVGEHEPIYNHCTNLHCPCRLLSPRSNRLTQYIYVVLIKPIYAFSNMCIVNVKQILLNSIYNCGKGYFQAIYLPGFATIANASSRIVPLFIKRLLPDVTICVFLYKYVTDTRSA